MNTSPIGLLRPYGNAQDAAPHPQRVARPIGRFSYRALFVLAALFALSTSTEAATPLHLFSWDSYIDPEVVAEFEREFDAQLVIEVFDSDSQRDVHLTNRDGRGYDLIVVDGTQLNRYASRGWLAPVDGLDIANRQYVDKRWATAVPGAERYGTAYFWGTLGIAWREDLWPQGFTSWKQFLNPSPALNGGLIMTSHARELVGIALKAAGASANVDDPSIIDAAGTHLINQTASVGYYGYFDLDETAPLVQGSAIAAMMYNGDALVLRTHNPKIRYEVPEEGGLLWIDFMTLSAFSSQPELAADFINFLNRPIIAARQAQYLQYASPNTGATELLPTSFLSNEDIYPKDAVIAKSEFLQPLSTQSQRRVNVIGAQLMAHQR